MSKSEMRRIEMMVKDNPELAHCYECEGPLVLPREGLDAVPRRIHYPGCSKEQK